MAARSLRQLEYQARWTPERCSPSSGCERCPASKSSTARCVRRSLRLPRGLWRGRAALARRVGGGAACGLTIARDEAAAAAGLVRSMLDLDTDPAAVADALGRDSVMAPLVQAAPGRRVPGCADGGRDRDPRRARAAGVAGGCGDAGRAAGWRPMARLWRIRSDPSRMRFPRRRCARRCERSRDRWRPVGDARFAQAGRSVGSPRCSHRARSPSIPMPTGTRPKIAFSPCPASGRGPRATSPCAPFAIQTPSSPPIWAVKHALDRLGLDSRPKAADEALSQSWRPYRAYALQHLWAVAS